MQDQGWACAPGAASTLGPMRAVLEAGGPVPGPRGFAPAAGLLALVLAAAGCCSRVVPAPAHHVSVYVLTDGFHSTLAVPTAHPRLARFADRCTHVELGFSDLAWSLGHTDSLVHASRLGLIPDTSVVEVDLLPSADPHLWADGRRWWAVPLGRRGWEALVERLDEWIAWDRPLAGYGSPRLVYYHSPRTFSAYRSCNDFVADLLDAAGLPICPRPWRTAGILVGQVEDGLRGAAAAGAVAVDPP